MLNIIKIALRAGRRIIESAQGLAVESEIPSAGGKSQLRQDS